MLQETTIIKKLLLPKTRGDRWGRKFFLVSICQPSMSLKGGGCQKDFGQKPFLLSFQSFLLSFFLSFFFSFSSFSYFCFLCVVGLDFFLRICGGGGNVLPKSLSLDPPLLPPLSLIVILDQTTHKQNKKKNKKSNKKQKPTKKKNPLPYSLLPSSTFLFSFFFLYFFLFFFFFFFLFSFFPFFLFFSFFFPKSALSKHEGMLVSNVFIT